MKTYKGILKSLPDNGIFVFGSNTEGRHGAGAAKYAYTYFGAIYGSPGGFQGHSYAIITKNLYKKVHPSVSPEIIISQITKLYDYALLNKELDFYIAYSANGNNLNGYTPQEMANMFSAAGEIPENIVFEEGFSKLLK